MCNPPRPGGRGTQFPGRLPVHFRRVEPVSDAQDLVLWWWLSTWDLAPGEESTQHVLGFPTSNLVVEDSAVGFAGPTTKASQRVLEGSGWVIGALLRPAAVPAFAQQPGALRDQYVAVCAPGLRECVVDTDIDGLEQAVPRCEAWLWDRVRTLTQEARNANRMLSLAMDEPQVHTVTELAQAVGVSERTVHRLAHRYVGLSPYALIRRRRLQEAAEHIRDHPDMSIAEAAARFGFTDQAHLNREFRTTLGRTPASYRREARGTSAEQN